MILFAVISGRGRCWVGDPVKAAFQRRSGNNNNNNNNCFLLATTGRSLLGLIKLEIDCCKSLC